MGNNDIVPSDLYKTSNHVTFSDGTLLIYDNLKVVYITLVNMDYSPPTLKTGPVIKVCKNLF